MGTSAINVAATPASVCSTAKSDKETPITGPKSEPDSTNFNPDLLENAFTTLPHLFTHVTNKIKQMPPV